VGSSISLLGAACFKAVCSVARFAVYLSVQDALGRLPVDKALESQAALRHQKVIQRAVHALEEHPNVAAIVVLAQLGASIRKWSRAFIDVECRSIELGSLIEHPFAGAADDGQDTQVAPQALAPSAASVTPASASASWPSWKQVRAHCVHG
jgi:hypothetical protein